MNRRWRAERIDAERDSTKNILIIVESVLASRGELGKKAHGDLSKVTSGLVVHGSGGFLT